MDHCQPHAAHIPLHRGEYHQGAPHHTMAGAGGPHASPNLTRSAPGAPQNYALENPCMQDCVRKGMSGPDANGEEAYEMCLGHCGLLHGVGSRPLMGVMGGQHAAPHLTRSAPPGAGQTSSSPGAEIRTSSSPGAEIRGKEMEGFIIEHILRPIIEFVVAIVGGLVKEAIKAWHYGTDYLEGGQHGGPHPTKSAPGSKTGLKGLDIVEWIYIFLHFPELLRKAINSWADGSDYWADGSPY